jgi:hypothetical protein
MGKCEISWFLNFILFGFAYCAEGIRAIYKCPGSDYALYAAATVMLGIFFFNLLKPKKEEG